MEKNDETRKHSDKSLELTEQLARADPESAQANRDLALAYMRRSSVSFDTNRLQDSVKDAKNAILILEKMSQRDAADVFTTDSLGTAYQILGKAHLQLWNLQEAKACREKHYSIAAALSEKDPSNASARRNVALACMDAGDVCLVLDDPDAARKHYTSALEISRELTKADPANALLQEDTVRSLYQLARAELAAFRYPQAKAVLGEGCELLLRLKLQWKFASQPNFSQWLAACEQGITRCEMAPRAIADLNYALEQKPPMATELLIVRVIALAKRGDHAASVETAEKLAAIDRRNLDNVHHAVCGYALSIAAVGLGKPAEKRTGAENSIREHYAARAVELLRQIIQEWYSEINNMRTDPQLRDRRDSLADHLARYINRMRTDPRLRALQERDDFIAMLAEFKG